MLKESEESMKAYLESAPDAVCIQGLKGSFLYGDKKAEELLNHDWDLIQTLFENHPDFLYFKDREARFHRVSKRFCDFLGLSMEDIIGKTDLELFPEEVAEQTHSEDLHVIKTGTPLVNKEESAWGVWVLTIKIPWFGKEGNIIGLFGISRDITERKKAEELLRASEQQFRSITYTANEAIITANHHGTIAMWNHGAETVFGYSADETFGKQITIIIPERYRKVYSRGLKRVVSTGKPVIIGNTVELFGLRKDGSEFPLELSLATWETGESRNFTAIIRNVTEQKHTHDALRESEQKYRSLFDNMLNGFAYCKILVDEDNQSIDFVYLEVNDAFERLTGLKRDDVISRKVTEVIPGIKEEHPELFSIYGKVALTREMTKFEIHFEPLEIWLTVSVYSPQKGYVAAVFEDITERKRMEGENEILLLTYKEQNQIIVDSNFELEKALTNVRQAEAEIKISRDEYLTITNLTGDIIVKIDTEGKWTFLNDGACQFFNKPREELIGSAFADYLHPDDREKTLAAIEKIKNGREVNGLVNRQKAPGGWRTVEWNGVGIFDAEGRFTSFQATGRDITGRKQMDEAIKSSCAELDQIFNATADGMRVIGKDFIVLRVNDAYAALTGVSKDEAVGKKCYELFNSPQCHTPGCFLTRVLSGEEYIEGEMEKVHNDGRKILCRLTVTPFGKHNGELVGILENFKDITELRKTQEQLQHSQLMTSLGEMTAGIAHEVNNPLGSVLLYSELLMASEVSSQTKRDLKVIHSETKRAVRIMTDLLVYSGRVKPRMNRLNLSKILKKVLTMRRYVQRVQNINSSANFGDGPVYVKGSSLQLMQVFMNILINAEDAIRESKKAKGGNINITVEKNGEWAKVSIDDNGTGIPKENLNQVFHPFFTTKPVGEGTGLGLSTCYGIITDHGGLLRAKNNDMGGATFDVELPLAEGKGDSYLKNKWGKEGKPQSVNPGGGYGNKEPYSPGC